MPTTLDRIVAQRVTDALYLERSLRMEAGGIRICTVDGTVTLEGSVRCPAASARARDAVLVVEGVLRVEDRLVVRQPQAAGGGA